MAVSKQDRFKFVNEVGYEAFQLITKRMEELGPVAFAELFPSLVGAATVCLANVLGQAVEAANNRSLAADNLVTSSAKQVRSFLQPVVAQQS
ncbi:hypothetical protein GCM10010872_22020 [Dyella flava]|nr:hypothetical protein GCM10010872_22020 [Dyella flava]